MNLPGNEVEMISATNSISEETRRTLGAKIFPKGSVIFPKVGGAIATNKKRLIVRPACVDNNIMGVTPDPARISSRLLYYFFQAHDLSEFANDAGLPSITKSTVENWNIGTIPPLAEQQRIIELLDEAFIGLATAHANAEKNLQNARALFESQLQSVFIERGREWLEKPLSELCDIKHGFAFDGEFFTSKGEYVLLTPGNFFEKGGYRDRGAKQKFYAGEIPRGYVLNKGDLLVAMTEQAAGLLGSPAIVPDDDKFLHNQRLGLVTPKSGIPWTNEFFFHVFNTPQVRRDIHASASGVKVRHTSPSKIGEVVVAFPSSISEQREIVSRFTMLSVETQRLESLYRQKLAALVELEKALLHQAFTGELTREWRESKSVSFPVKLPKISVTELHAGLVAMAYQAHEKLGNPTDFGHVKSEKITHMEEALVGIELGRNPVKDAAGPNDFPRLKEVELWAREGDYYRVDFIEGHHYLTPLAKFDELVARTERALGDRKGEVDRLLSLMVPMDRTEAAIFATVFAAWNNLLLDGEPISDERIVHEARDNWHPDKLKIPKKRFFEMIAWMREENLIPEGKGKRVVEKQSDGSH